RGRHARGRARHMTPRGVGRRARAPGAPPLACCQASTVGGIVRVSRIFSMCSAALLLATIAACAAPSEPVVDVSELTCDGFAKSSDDVRRVVYLQLLDAGPWSLYS